MKKSKFILDASPKVQTSKLSLGDKDYELDMQGGQGGVFRAFQYGILREELYLTINDLKALFLLLGSPENN